MKMFRNSLILLLPLSLVAWGVYHFYPVTSEKPKVARDAPEAKAGERKDLAFDFRAAIEAAMALPPAKRQATVAQAIRQQGLVAIAEDARWFLNSYLKEDRKGEPGIKRRDWMNYLNRFILQDPTAAAEMLLSEGRIGEKVTEPDGALLMSVWAGLNPRQVISWGKSGGNDREEWLRTKAKELAQGWAAADLPGLLDYFADGGTEPSITAAMNSLDQQRGTAAAEQWLDTQQGQSKLADEARDGAATFVVQQKLIMTNPALVADWVGKRTQLHEILAGIQNVAVPYVMKDLEKGMNWMEGFSDKVGFPHYIAELSMGIFATRDLDAAENWLKAHQNSPLAAAYIWGFSVQAALVDMDRALTWVPKLPAKGGWGTEAPEQWGSPAAAKPIGESGMQNLLSRMDVALCGGLGREQLEYQIRVAGRAGQLWRDPNAVLAEIPGNPPMFSRYDFPVLVKESGDERLVLTMKLHHPGNCHTGQDASRLPFPVYVRKKDGSLILEQYARN